MEIELKELFMKGKLAMLVDTTKGTIQFTTHGGPRWGSIISRSGMDDEVLVPFVTWAGSLQMDLYIPSAIRNALSIVMNVKWKEDHISATLLKWVAEPLPDKAADYESPKLDFIKKRRK